MENVGMQCNVAILPDPHLELVDFVPKVRVGFGVLWEPNKNSQASPIQNNAHTYARMVTTAHTPYVRICFLERALTHISARLHTHGAVVLLSNCDAWTRGRADACTHAKAKSEGSQLVWGNASWKI